MFYLYKVVENRSGGNKEVVKKATFSPQQFITVMPEPMSIFMA